MVDRGKRAVDSVKRPPSRQAGEGAREQYEQSRSEVAFEAVFAPFVLIMLAAMAWYQYLTDIGGWLPIIISAMALLSLPHSWFRYHNKLGSVRSWKQGMIGEMHVADRLRRLEQCQHFVYHDVQGARGNIDHVVIGPGGVYAIETKNPSKPPNGPPEATVHEDRIYLSTDRYDDQAIGQALAVASELRDILQRDGVSVPVTPVVLLPEWFIRGRHSEVWMMEPKGFVKQVIREAEQHSNRELEPLRQAVRTLRRHVANSEDRF